MADLTGAMPAPGTNPSFQPSQAVGYVRDTDGSYQKPFSGDVNTPMGRVAAKGVSKPWQTVLSDSAHIKVDWTKGDNVYHALTENTTVDNPAVAPPDGTEVCFLFLNTTDNRTVAWGDKFLFVGAAAPVVTVGAKSSMVYFMYHAGTNKYYEKGRFLNM